MNWFAISQADYFDKEFYISTLKEVYMMNWFAISQADYFDKEFYISILKEV